MGTWSAGSFGNDVALDFLAEITNTEQLMCSFRAVSDTEGLIEFDAACEAIAAADLVAAMNERPAEDTPIHIEGILLPLGKPDKLLLTNAIRAVECVRNFSELAELWAESGDRDWEYAVGNLLWRLDSNRPFVSSPENLKNDNHEVSGGITSLCFFCEKNVSNDEEVELAVDENMEGIVSSYTVYAHRNCVEERFEPPHYHADGSPHPELLEQFRKAIEL